MAAASKRSKPRFRMKRSPMFTWSVVELDAEGRVVRVLVDEVRESTARTILELAKEGKA